MPTDTKFEYIYNDGPSLGTRSDEVIHRKKKYGERVFGEPLSLEVVDQIDGPYKKGTILDNCILFEPSDINNFKFYRKILTSQQHKSMDVTPRLVYPNKSLRCSSNPYSAQLNQVKLFSDKKKVFRCKIKDLFCASDKQLSLRCNIYLIDEGEHLYDVSYDSIFDFPQSINYLAEIESEIKEAAIYLGPTNPSFCNSHINRFFQELSAKMNNLFSIKILDFINDRYYVDLIDAKGFSFISSLRKKFKVFRKFCLSLEQLPTTANQNLITTFPAHRMRHPESRINRKRLSFNASLVLGGASGYFEHVLRNNLKDSNKSHIEKRFFKVRLVRWYDPDSFSLLPDDPNFFNFHQYFIEKLNELPCIKCAEDSTYLMNEPFSKGELVIFRNESVDKEIGGWLRGIVEHVFSYDFQNLSGATSLNHSTVDSNNLDQLKHFIEDGIIELTDLFYRVRSIDYGFICTSGHIYMRHVQQLTEFKRYGPWTMRCQLFGIQPFEMNVECKSVGGRFSTTCSDIINIWVRERLLDRNEQAAFHILFRTDLNEEMIDRQFTETISISLFHRFEPPYTIEEALKPRRRKTKFECLNAYLVDQGFVTDALFDEKGSSNILLDEYVVNALVCQNRL